MAQAFVNTEIKRLEHIYTDALTNVMADLEPLGIYNLKQVPSNSTFINIKKLEGQIKDLDKQETQLSSSREVVLDTELSEDELYGLYDQYLARG